MHTPRREHSTHIIGQYNISLPLISNSLDNFVTTWSSSLEKYLGERQSTEERRDVMLRQGKAHERRDAEAKHLREHRDAEPDKASAHREQEQRDTLRQRKSGVMLRQSNAHEQEQ